MRLPRAIERIGLAALRQLDPERAHRLSLAALRLGLGTRGGPLRRPGLEVRLAGLELPNPLGLAAGYDKSAEAPAALARAGFGFVELGAVTPRPQPGNPRPRLFRLPAERAVINRMGFNNDGAETVAARLARWREAETARGGPPVPVGLNLGANKDSPDRAADFAEVLRRCGPWIDFATVNVSSPNTERLRDLQGPAALARVLEQVLEARAALARPVPVFVKIAPDLTEAEIDALAETVLAAGIDGVIATNTTISRPPGLRGAAAGEAGGLSGPPLFALSTRVLARLFLRLGGRLPLIGVGGIDSPETAWAKITAGASALQIYTALIWEGPGLIEEILDGLAARLRAAGLERLEQATGTEAERWSKATTS
ncbi:MAG: quinone-dependent dihydroorotate dehydrogenase [Alphaproteobacteria bacterium]|nr:MAG: quinone-dependent dihydroorotate dehydrogenase [Alphaproteobacteria bacterium]